LPLKSPIGPSLSGGGASAFELRDGVPLGVAGDTCCTRTGEEGELSGPLAGEGPPSIPALLRTGGGKAVWF
jgi:hypothetical protein